MEKMIGQELEYEITETEKHVDGVGSITVYGVLVYERGCASSKDKTKCCRLSDVSSQEKIARSFLQTLSDNKVSPINVEECFEDFCTL